MNMVLLCTVGHGRSNSLPYSNKYIMPSRQAEKDKDVKTQFRTAAASARHRLLSFNSR